MVAREVQRVKIESFLHDERRFALQDPTETDPFVDLGALQEAALLDVRIDLIRSRALMLFDLKGALQVRDGNTGVLVIDKLESLDSEMPVEPFDYHYPTVVGWVPSSLYGNVTIEIGLLSDASYRVVGQGGEFFVGNVPGMDEAPPDVLKANEDGILAGFQNWSSEFEPLQALFHQKSS